MEWFDFYDNYYDFNDKALRALIPVLEDIGSGDEVCDVIDSIDDPDIKVQLIRKAIELEAEFTEDDYYRLDGQIPSYLYEELALKGNMVLSGNDEVADILSSLFDDDAIDALYKRALADGIRFTNDQLEMIGKDEDVPEEEEGDYESSDNGIGFFGALLGIAGAFASTSSSNSKKKHSGKCDGDCANCPPHYGYRYGRWYYGHCHAHGCEFGGNKCNGGRD